MQLDCIAAHWPAVCVNLYANAKANGRRKAEESERERESRRKERQGRLVVFLLRCFCSSSIRIAFQYINIYTQVNLRTAEQRIRRSHSGSHSGSRIHNRRSQHARLIDKLEMKIYEAAAGSGSD